MHTTHPSPRGTRDARVAAVLEDAALYLVCYGWCQQHYFEQTSQSLPRACALGAIHAVTAADPAYRAQQTVTFVTYTPPAMRAIAYLADFLDDGIYRDDKTPTEVVWAFNDHDDTTKDLVVHALRTAAKRARVELADEAVRS